MALFTTRQKQQALTPVLLVVVAIAVLAALVRWWYITVPVAIVLVAWLIYSQRQSANRRTAAQLEAAREAEVQEQARATASDQARVETEEFVARVRREQDELRDRVRAQTLRGLDGK